MRKRQSTGALQKLAYLRGFQLKHHACKYDSVAIPMSLLNLLLPKAAAGFVKASAGVTMAVGQRYIAFAGIAWLLGYVIFRRQWLHRKNHPASAPLSRRVAGNRLLGLDPGDLWRDGRGDRVGGEARPDAKCIGTLANTVSMVFG